VHEFVLPYVEHSWLQDRPSGAELVEQGRGTTERGDERTIIRLRPRPSHRLSSPADAEALGVDTEEQAQQVPVARTRPFLAAFPLRHHVGVDADMLPAAQPRETRYLVRYVLLRPTALLA